MKIIITGSCGHIGSYIVENLPKIKKIKTAILIDNLESNRFNSTEVVFEREDFN